MPDHKRHSQTGANQLRAREADTSSSRAPREEAPFAAEAPPAAGSINAHAIPPPLFQRALAQAQRLHGNAAASRLVQRRAGLEPQRETNLPGAREQALAVEPYASVALNLRERLRSGGAAGQAIRRKVTTWAGEWRTAKYRSIRSKGKKIGVEIDLRFKPGAKVNAKQIGTLQIVKSVNEGKALAINAAVKDRNIPEGQPGAGFHVDQAPHNRNPLYAVEGAPATDTALTDTGADAGWGQHGFRYKNAAGKVKKRDASLKDTPKLPGRGANASQIFETTALAIEGEQAGTYYGSVQWGWETDSAGKFTRLPLTVVSDDAPSDIFAAASKQWNTTKTSSGDAALSLPIVSARYVLGQAPLVSDPANGKTTEIGKIPVNTRVQLIDDGASHPVNTGAAVGEKWQKVTVVTGTMVGSVGWVMERLLGEYGLGDFPAPNLAPGTALA